MVPEDIRLDFNWMCLMCLPFQTVEQMLNTQFSLGLVINHR